MLFAVWMSFLDENSLLNRYEHKKQLAELRREIRHYKESYEHDTRYLKEMNTNPEVVVEIAREQYYMKKSDEDVFVLLTPAGDEDAQ